ncbi:MAG: carotenoid oxygenase family protein [Spirillospora sp.]
MTSVPYISGHYAPVADEHTATELRIRGALPPELDGRYIRNGHNPKPGITPSHWFRGSGMLHGVRLRDGRAEWYRNRWVHTPAFDRDAPLVRADGSIDLTASVAGTHIIEHAGRYLALQEANLPFEIDRDLGTVGPFNFGGALTTAMTAHPKQDPVTGELHFFAYSPFPPHVVYYVASADGEIVRMDSVDGAGTSLMHDFAITENHVVWLDLPVVFDASEQSGIPYSWSDDYAPRIGVMPRTGDAVPRWFDVNPAALLHVTNAFEDSAGRVVLDGPRYDRASWESSWKWWTGAPGHPAVPVTGAVSSRWTLDPSTGKAGEETLDDLVTEFPTINDDHVGRTNRYAYAVTIPGAGQEEYGLVKYDSTTGARQVRPAGPDVLPGEAVFVPAEGGTAEDDGYLLTITSDVGRDASELLVLDARDLGAPAIAAVELPRRVPSGIHGSWIPENEDA